MLFYAMLAALCDDDRSFVTEIYECHKNKIYAIAIGILHNEHDAGEAPQETMIQIINNIDAFRESNKDELKNKLMILTNTIARNVAINIYRRKQTKQKYEGDMFYKSDDDDILPLDVEDTSSNTEETVISNEEYRHVRDALLRISSDLADAVNLVYYCGLPCSEAAKLVGISDSAMRNRIFQAKKKLREILREEFGE